jgi:Na+/proline symporter
MSEPVSAALGVKLGTIIAGFAGGVVSLAFIQGLNRWQAIAAVVVGALTATYLTPVAVYKLSITTPEMQNGAAFVIGLCAMNIIPAIKRSIDSRVNSAAASAKGTPP